MVVLPEHLHTIWTLPENDSDYPGRWQSIKSIFSRELEKNGIPVGKRKDGSALISIRPALKFASPVGWARFLCPRSI